MLSPRQINPLQLPRVSRLLNEAIQIRALELGCGTDQVDPLSSEVQLFVAELILERGCSWRQHHEKRALRLAA